MIHDVESSVHDVTAAGTEVSKNTSHNGRSAIRYNTTYAQPYQSKEHCLPQNHECPTAEFPHSFTYWQNIDDWISGKTAFNA